MEFQVGQHKYSSRKLDAFDQLFIVKRLAGAIKGILPPELMTAIASKATEEAAPDIDPMKYFDAFATAANKLADQDLVFIINTCCKACSRMSNGAWAPLTNGDTIVFMDISRSPVALLQITFNVISENLTSFFEELRSILDQAEPKKPLA
jgi:hypothetical protein